MMHLILFLFLSLVPVEEIDAAMKRVITQGLPEHKIQPCPRCVGARDDQGRRELAQAILIASTLHEVPIGLLCAIAYREGAFNQRAVGKIGELSTFQIMPRHGRRLGCDLSTHAGGAQCAAQLLRQGYDECGDWGGAIAHYATGKGCMLRTRRVKWLVRDRLRLARRFDEYFTRHH